jgi:membrane-associated protein
MNQMFDVTNLLSGAGVLLGLVIIGGIIFSESGMLVGFFMPGDTLLLTAGAFAAAGKLPVAGVIVVVAIAAIAGDNVGYVIGKRYGRRLFKKEDGLLFRHEYVMRAENFYEKYGSKTMLLAHFVPVVRTFAPIVAGIARMNRAQFFIFDAIGDIAWAIALTLIGYYVGKRIPGIDHYFMLAVFGAVLLTFGPMMYHLITDKKFHAKLRARMNKRSSAAEEK